MGFGFTALSVVAAVGGFYFRPFFTTSVQECGATIVGSASPLIVGWAGTPPMSHQQGVPASLVDPSLTLFFSSKAEWSHCHGPFVFTTS